NQDLFIKRIINHLSVHFDPSSVEFSMEDAKYAFVEELVDKKAFERMYKGAEVSDFDGSKALFGGWLQNDKVRVAEYFYKDPVRTKIVEISDGTVIPLVDGMTIEKIKAMGEIPVRDRMVDSHVVKWVKMSGAEVLEESEWPGRDIPIIPVFGDEIVIDGKRHYLSLARGAKDPQQMYNFWATAATETVALAPKNPFIVDHRQIKGFEKEWEEANHKNRMYIRYNAVAGLNKPAKEQQTQIPTAIMNMMQTCAYDIEDHLGRYESSKGETSNERSGKAIIARINQADKGTYTFVDNLARAIIACGKQLVDLIPKIYDTQRAIRIMGETGEHEVVDVNKPVADENGLGVENDLTVGKFDVISTVGASYTSKREEMVEMMIQSMQYAGPEISAMIVPLIFKYSDWPGSEEISQTLQKKIEQAQQGQQMQQGQK
ncbi:MAG: portal protein, partial [Spirochaetales bacterium]|nr:portal protein [Spirochaetales bacterium]